MLRWFFLLLVGVAAVSMVMGSTVHAAEIPASGVSHCIDIDTANDGSHGDEAPAEKSTQFAHASCHAPAAALPSFEGSIERTFVRSPVAAPYVNHALVSLIVAPDIRPPIA